MLIQWLRFYPNQYRLAVLKFITVCVFYWSAVLHIRRDHLTSESRRYLIENDYVMVNARISRYIVYRVIRVTLLYNTTLLRYYSTTLLYNTTLQHYSTTLLYNTTLQHYSTTLLYNTTLQHYSTTLLYNTALQHYSTTLLYNTTFTTLLYDATLQHYSTALLSNCTIVYILDYTLAPTKF